MHNFSKFVIILKKRRKAYEKCEKIQKRGGTSLLDSQRAAGPDTQIVSENTPEVGEDKKEILNRVQGDKVTCHCEGAMHVDMSDSFGRSYACHCEERSDVAIAMSTYNNEIPEQVRDDDNNEITTSNAAHSPRNDMDKYAKPVKNDVVAQPPRNDKNITPHPLGRGIKGEGLSHEMLKQVQDDKYVSEAHRKELNVLTSYRLNNFKKKAAFTLAEGATHVDMSGNIRRVAFTLAEVLITLGIIGVVAAMTIPTLIANYREKVMVTKVKQGHSLLMNAIQLYMAQNNCINALCLFDTKKTSEQVAAELGTVLKGAKLCKAGDTGKFCKTYYYKANQPIKIDGVYGAGDSLGPRGRIYLPNGISFQTAQVSECPRTVTSIIRDENGFEIDRKEVVSENCAYIYMDVNNVEEPNQFGADMYRYDAKISGKVVPTNQKLLNSVLIYNKLEYTPYNIGDPIE